MPSGVAEGFRLRKSRDLEKRSLEFHSDGLFDIVKLTIGCRVQASEIIKTVRIIHAGPKPKFDSV